MEKCGLQSQQADKNVSCARGCGFMRTELLHISVKSLFT